MGNIIKSIEGQSLLDLSIQSTGLAENYLKIAIANNLVPTDKLSPGKELIIPEGVVVNKDMLRYYQSKGITPATEISNEIIDDGLSDLTCEEELYECFK